MSRALDARRLKAAQLVGLWDRWQSTGGPGTGMDIWEWAAEAAGVLRAYSGHAASSDRAVNPPPGSRVTGSQP